MNQRVDVQVTFFFSSEKQASKFASRFSSFDIQKYRTAMVKAKCGREEIDENCYLVKSLRITDKSSLERVKDGEIIVDYLVELEGDSFFDINCDYGELLGYKNEDDVKEIIEDFFKSMGYKSDLFAIKSRVESVEDMFERASIEKEEEDYYNNSCRFY